MACTRFQTDGMKFLDGEMSSAERHEYEMHVRQCEDCSLELKNLGRIVELTRELKLREPDEAFWQSYWKSVYRRLERGTGFLVLIVGLVVASLYGIYRLVTSPDFLTVKGLSISAILVGLLVIFLSVLRERYHEHKSDPYKGVEQ